MRKHALDHFHGSPGSVVTRAGYGITIGGLIHLLLVIALVVLAINIVQGRSAL